MSACIYVCMSVCVFALKVCGCVCVHVAFFFFFLNLFLGCVWCWILFRFGIFLSCILTPCLQTECERDVHVVSEGSSFREAMLPT